MTLSEAKQALKDGRFYWLETHRPAGTTIREVVDHALSVCGPLDLDMVADHVLLTRNDIFDPFTGTVTGKEDDIQFRSRVNRYLMDVIYSKGTTNKAFIPSDVSDSKPRCTYHRWKTYVGIFEKFDYCEICDEKRK